MRNLKRVVLMVLAFMLMVLPVCAVAETALTNTVWQVNATVGQTKGTTILRFYDDQMFLRMGGMKGAYSFDKVVANSGELTMKIVEKQDKTVTIGGQSANVTVEAGMAIKATAVLNKKGTSMTLKNLSIKAEIGSITPKGLLDTGMPLPFTAKLVKVSPRVNKVLIKGVALGSPSTVNIKASAASEWYVAYDAAGKVLAQGEVQNGEASFKHTFTEKKNPITVKTGLLDQNGKLLENTLSKAVKAVAKTK